MTSARIFVPTRHLQIRQGRRVGGLPPVDRVVIEYGVTHWNVMAVHGRFGARVLLGQPGSIGRAVDLAQRVGRARGLPVAFAAGATGWTHLLRAGA